MFVFQNPFFYLPVLVFVINQFLQRILHLILPILHSYLDDLLAIPVILGITLQIYQKIHPQRQAFSFTPTQILVAVLYVSVVFEWVLPQYSTTYTADLLDVVCYLLGAGYFYFFINR
jgi:hypothetical protein